MHLGRRIILVRNLDKKRRTLDLSTCATVEGRGSDSFRHFMHKGPNGRFYQEKYPTGFERGEAHEVTLEEALDWCFDRAEDFDEAVIDLGILDELEDANRLKRPRHVGQIVVRCLNCERQRRLSTSGRPTKRKKVLEVLKKTSKAVSARQVAKLAGLKCDAHLRQILSSLVQDGKVTKPRGAGGYVLAHRLAPKKKS
jgi:hypothetical protein